MDAPADPEPDVWTALLDRLYGGPLDAFVGERDAAARAARSDGDRALATRIGALAKPTLAAWVVDQAVRTLPQAVDGLLALGDALRAATAAHDRARLVALDRDRRRLLDALLSGIEDTVRPGGRALSEATLRAVRDTFVAAVADADAAAAVRAGHLARGLQHVGFGVVDKSGEQVDLAPADLAPAVVAPRDQEQDAVAEAALDAAEAALDAARATVRERAAAEDAVMRDLAAASAALHATEDAIARLTQQAEAQRAERATLASAADDARVAREAAEGEVERLDADRAAAQEAVAARRPLRDAHERS